MAVSGDCYLRAIIDPFDDFAETNDQDNMVAVEFAQIERET